MNLNGNQGSPYQGLTQIRPYDFGTDAIERQRVSLGQAMMDADFEYGLQATKWQSFFEIRKFPSFYEIAGTDATISNVASDGTGPNSNITVYYNNVYSTPQTVGGVISIFGLSNPAKTADRAEGYFLVTANNVTANTANYIAKGVVPSGNIQTNLTFSKKGGIYNSGLMNLQFSTVKTDTSGNVQVFSNNAHGLLPGCPVYANSANITNFTGTFFVSSVTSANSFNLTSNSTVTFASGANMTLSNTQIYIDPYASTQHRPYDGGVLLSSLAPAHGGTIIRQSKKCFRYQSGKGILFSSGTLFCPNLDIASVVVTGLSSTLTSNSNGLTGVSLVVSNPSYLGIGQNVAFSPAQTNCFVSANVLSYGTGGAVTFQYSNTFTTVLPTTVTQNAVVTTTVNYPAASITVPMANTVGLSYNQLAQFGTLGSFYINSVVASPPSLQLQTYPYGGIPAGITVTQGSFSNLTTGSTGPQPFVLPIVSSNGFLVGEPVTVSNSFLSSTLGSLTIVSNSSSSLGLSYTGTANAAVITYGNTAFLAGTTIFGIPVSITGTGNITANVSTGLYSAGQVVASYLGQNLGTVTITGTRAVNSNAQVVLNYTGSFPPQGIPNGTSFTTCPPGSNLQVITDLVHGIPTSGATVTIRNVTSSNINGTNYIVSAAVDSRTINVQSQSTISSIPVFLGDQPRLIVSNWHGATVRAGVFEDPNGMFWEWDGQTLFVVRRQSTYQCAGYAYTSPLSQVLIGSNTAPNGTCTVTTPVTPSVGDTTALLNVNNGHTVVNNMYANIPGIGYVWVIGAPDYFQIQIGFLPISSVNTPPTISGTLTFFAPTTRFQDQLKVNDRFTIRGMAHQVTSIQGQGVLTFTPPYRGSIAIPSTSPIKVCKIKELRIPQSAFNRDTMDGKGPSGYKVDLTRMQMIGIQYTWYGAGFIDYMMRGPDGNWIYAHRIKNNNVNDEAYMRSGNLPVRYELSVEGRASVTSLASSMAATDAVMTTNDQTAYFPSAGTLLVDNELISYTGVTPNSFTGLTRAAPLTYVVNDISRTFTGQAASTHLSGTSVNLVSCSATPTLTHWGSSFLTDGQFDTERGYYFNYSNTNIVLGSSASAVAFSIRLAPSVTNGLSGDIGVKELLNRAQLLLQKLEVTSNVNVQTVGYLNPIGVTFNPSQWQNVNNGTNGAQPSFVQYYPGNLTTTMPQPGERIFQTIVQGANQNNLDLSNLKEMSNSILSGQQAFPDGPDILTVQVTNLSNSNASVQVNLFWSEAQA
jgi:hypothetical protein